MQSPSGMFSSRLTFWSFSNISALASQPFPAILWCGRHHSEEATIDIFTDLQKQVMQAVATAEVESVTDWVRAQPHLPQSEHVLSGRLCHDWLSSEEFMGASLLRMAIICP